MTNIVSEQTIQNFTVSKMNKKDIFYRELGEIQDMLENILLYIDQLYCEYDDGLKWVEEDE